MARITAPRLAATIEAADGTLTEYTVQTDNRDAVRFDLIRARKGWPSMQDAPLLFMTVLAWSALRRTGIDVAGDPELFIDSVVDLTPVDEDDEPTDDVSVGPTQPTA